MYICIYVCPSHLGMLISIRGMHWKYGARTQPHYCCQQATVHKHSSMMDQSARWITGLPRMKAIVCRGDQGTTCSPESLCSHRTAPNAMNI